MLKLRIHRKDAVAVISFFLSGGAALIYEVCWIREASLVFGSTMYALSTVLAVFFLGLACGSYLFGHVAQRTRQPLRLFAYMELLVGLLGLASPLAFDVLDTLYGMAYNAVSGQFALLMVIRFGLVSLVLLPPTILMGGTLPLFSRQFVDQESRIARSVGFLYGLNTLGAAVGCAATGLFMLPFFGISGAIRIGALLNVIVALSAGLLGLTARIDASSVVRNRKSGEVRRQTAVAILLFVIGYVALGNEVLWARHLALLIRNTVYTYTISLTAVLSGIVLGSLLAALYFDRVTSRAFWLGTIQVATGLVTMGLMLIPADIWARFHPVPVTAYFFLLLPPAVLSGASFPLGVRMVVEDPFFSGSGVGRLLAYNTFGGIAGSLSVGMILLPSFGQQSTLLVTTGLSLIGGFIAWILLDRRLMPVVRWLIMIASIIIWLSLPVVSGTNLPADFLIYGKKGNTLIAYWEAISSNIAVLQRPTGAKVMEINRLWQGQDLKNHQIIPAHVSMLLRSDPHSVLLVGVGAGQTASRFLMYRIDRLDCVDIEPAVFDVVREHFPSEWMDDNRVRLLSEDGRNYLAHSKELYDVISIEVGQIIRPGVPFFYTSDFYERVVERLNPGGFLVQFIPLPYFTLDQFRSVVSTFLHTFPQSFLWYNREEMLLIGVNDQKLKLKGERLVLLEEDPSGDNEVRHDLRITLVGDRDVSMHELPVFLGSFITGPEGLAHIGAGAPLYRDDRPILDYAVAHVREEDANEIPIVELLRENLSSVERIIARPLNRIERARIEETRQKNLDQLLMRARLRESGKRMRNNR